MFTLCCILSYTELTTHEERAEKCSAPGNDSNATTGAPLSWRGSVPPSVREILVYAVLVYSDSQEPYRARLPSSKLYSSAVMVANQFLQSREQISAIQLSNYFNRIKKPGNYGKYLGRLRTTRFRTIISSVVESCNTQFRKADSKSLDGGEVLEVRKVVEGAISQWASPPTPPTPSTSPTPAAMDFNGIAARINSMARWKAIEDDDLKAHYFSPRPGCPQLTVLVKRDFTFQLLMQSKIVDMTRICKPPEKLLTCEDIETVVLAIERADNCQGCRYDKYKDWIENRLDGGTFKNSSGAVVGKLETCEPTPCIRTVACPILVPAGTSSVCAACKALDGTLRRGLSRFKTRGTETSPHTAFIHLPQAKLVDMLRERRDKTSLVTRRLERLVASRERMETTKHNEEYASIFRQLEPAMNAVRERVENPTCKWATCRETFSTIDDLQVHIHFTHLNIEETSTQRQPLYKCRWESCKHTEFKNRQEFKSHITRHTGRQEDSFFAILLADQAKALSTSPEQMRWHPAVLRWCLQQHSRSQRTYEVLRNSGFLRLPSGRTLSRYCNYTQPETGWKPAKMAEMRQLYEKFIESKRGKGDRSFIGGLYFDEIKIKEGLVWDCGTNDLIGFVDSEEPVVDSNDKLVATHIMQFHFKSLFSNFNFPCAYFNTNSPTSSSINDMFWTGVEQLHSYGFRVQVCCCDGAASNRKFMMDNQALNSENPGSTLNPYGNWPLFFLSDPTHLIKKMRNNFSKSGYESWCTRLLTINNKPILWSHIKQVLKRDQGRMVQCTPLREQHVQLTSFSRMSSRLAYDVFNKRVEEDMQDNQQQDTISTREFMRNVRALGDVFSSHEKVSNPRDSIPRALSATMQWFDQWHTQTEKVPKAFISHQVYTDMKITAGGFAGLVQFRTCDPRVKHLNLYILPHRLTQDFVENYFSLQRSTGGANQNMTARAYGYQANAIAQTHVIPSNLGRAALDLPLTMRNTSNAPSASK
eukprot:scpid15668/ scgid30822/ 